MLPIAGVSAFLNNTPVVAVMIPIVQRWAENINVPKEQVIVPFSHVRTGNLRIFGILKTRYMD
jgi:Na+/H+ antiporter NhaD/arsenite permease-like protein